LNNYTIVQNNKKEKSTESVFEKKKKVSSFCNVQHSHLVYSAMNLLV